MLDFKELETFVWTVRLGSFRKAAAHLHLTQPTVSERISRLEDTVGERLLERSARPVKPTIRGRDFFQHAELMLRQRDEALALFDSEEDYSAPLRLGTIETIAHSWFPDFMRQLAKRHPRLTLELNVDYSPTLNRRFLKNELDILLAMHLSLPAKGIETQALAPYEMGMFVAPKHAAMLKGSGPSWLGKLPFISFGKKARPYQELVDYLADEGLSHPRIHGVNTLMTIASLTREGLGIGVLPVTTVVDEWRRGELLRLELRRPLPAMHYAVIWRSENLPTFCRSLAELAKESAEHYARERQAALSRYRFDDLWVRPDSMADPLTPSPSNINKGS